MWGWRSSRTVLLTASVAALGLFCVLPVGFMIVTALGEPDRAFSPFSTVLLDTRQRVLLYNTSVLGLATALSATLVGVPLGVTLARIRLPLKAALRLALAAPALLPSYVVGLAWLFLANGAQWIYSLPAAVAVLTLALYPFSMLATEAAMRRVEPRLEEAGLLVAPPGRVLWRITLPSILPSITAAALVVFVLAVSDFGVPALLRVRVFTTEVFTAFAALYDFARATALAAPLVIVAIAVAVIATKLAGERMIATRRGQTGGEPIAFDDWRPVGAVGVACTIVVALVLPIVALSREASGVSSWAAVVQGSSVAVRNSVTLAVFGATVVTTLALFLGYWRARASSRLAFGVDVMFVVLFAVPSTIVGIGLIRLWNRPGPFGLIYGTSAMFVLVYLARFLPVAALALGASIRRVPVSHEEAAAVSGAAWLRTMMRIVLPQIALGTLSAWVIVFILAFGELGASVLVTPPGESTLPIRIYTLIANAPPSQVAALALLQTVVVFCPLAMLGLTLAARRRT